MNDTLSISESQLQKILTTLGTLNQSGGIHWELVIPVFLSAALGMIVGIGLEYFKDFRNRKKLEETRYKQELSEINVATLGIALNVEALIHLTMQNILPHHYQTVAALRDLQAIGGDKDKYKSFVFALYKYPAVMMTAPDIGFVEHNYLERLPFIIERDPSLLQRSQWMTTLLRELRNATHERNKLVHDAQDAAVRAGGDGLDIYQLDTILQTQHSLSVAECVSAYQLFDLYVQVANGLQSVVLTYNVKGQKVTFHPPEVIKEAMKRLKEIVDGAAGDRQTVQ